MRQKLDALVAKHNLIRRTENSFREMLEHYLQEEPEESAENGFTDRESVRVELYGYAFWVANELSHEMIKVHLDIFVPDHIARIGDYWCVYDLNGELLDDCFDIV